MASSIPLAGLEVAARTLARIALSAALVAGALGCDDGPGASAGDAGDEAPAGEGEGEVGEGEVGEGVGEAGEGGGEAGEGGGEAGEGEGEAEGGAGRRERLEAAQTWMYQISQLDEGDAVAKLAATDYPLLVIEPGHNHRPCTEEFDPAAHGIPAGNADDACANVYDTAAMVAALRAGQPDRLLAAYIDVGQAEWYRDYWAPGWALPTPDQRGNPDFIVSADPDGWEGNYPVAYWHEDWKAIWLGTGAGAGAAGIVRELAELGFDGVYLDWVEAYDDESIQAAADDEGVDAAQEMVRFVEGIGAAGRAVHSDFLVIAQNATFLLDHAEDPARYAKAIDALAVEDTWFYGNGATEDWNAGDGDLGAYDISERLECEADACSVDIEAPDNVCPIEADSEQCLAQLPVSGDLHGGSRHGCADDVAGTPECWSTDNRLAAYERYLGRGVPVFTVDYCISDDSTAHAYREARRLGLRPLVTRVQLSRLTDTPPSDYD